VEGRRGGPVDLDMRDGPSHSSFMVGRQPADGNPATFTLAGPEPRGRQASARRAAVASASGPGALRRGPPEM
jgi:hypothetical protein